MREYARIQTFPDNWSFAGSLSSQYKQIGNDVPVNLAWAIGRSLIRLFNEMAEHGLYEPQENNVSVMPYRKLHGLFEGMVCEKTSEYKKV